MRYSSMRNLDISNGEGVGVSLFVQGCPFHCKNCFNSDTWDFNGGKEWTEETKNRFLKLINRPYIKRVSFLGGEPLAEQNVDGILSLIQEIRSTFPDKVIWLYTGYTFDSIMDGIGYDECGMFFFIEDDKKRYEAIMNVDVLVDGEYIDEQKDITLKWCGSRNQRVIDMVKTKRNQQIELYCN